MLMMQTDQQSDLSDYQWKYRIVIIDEQMVNANDQLIQLLAAKKELEDRELLVFLKTGNELICQNKELKAINVRNNRFNGITLIGKDGGTKLQRKEKVDNQIIFDLIDSMPMRRAEIRSKSG